MPRGRLLAFIDCNILIAGMFVAMHPAQAIMVLASNKHLNLVTSAEVIEDIEDEILDRATAGDDYELVDICAQLIRQTRVKVLPNPSVALVKMTYLKIYGYHASPSRHPSFSGGHRTQARPDSFG